MPSILERPSINIDRTIWDAFKDLRQKFINRTVPPLFVDYVNSRIGIGKADADFPLDVHVVSNFRDLIQGRGFLMHENCTIGGFLSLGDNLLVDGDVLIQRGLQCHEKAWFWGGISIAGGSIDIDNVVLTSPNGTRFRLTVDNEGVLITTQL